MPSKASSVGVPVFTDTNLGTRLAVAIPPDTTAGDFKRELERAHLNCFPKLGKIRIHGLMVKRKSCFYHLPESLPIKHAFQGLKGTWFLHMEACPWGGFDKADEGVIADKRAGLVESRTEGEHTEEWNYSPRMENPSETTLSEAISVTYIIKKYFSDCD
ncbi:hypothetical protein F0562_008697 [Nyssa sinensis]|uniref:Uncharacterized protein n=1 Tax=Nyssa sinensis TaxID=561372 RepID=A0A5J5AA24_9ASTE|nr:hypothetical protein F0562_008697 [Nyssa sinensis]